MKKLFTALLVSMMVFSSVLPVAAQESATLTEAIKLAKSLFPTESFTQFRSSHETYNGQTTYYLYWYGEEAESSPARLTVRVDAQRLLITGYNYQPAYQEQTYPALPKVGEEACLIAAEAFAAKLAPEQFAQMKLEKVEKPQVRIEKRSWPLSYTFRYVHYVNGIAFQPNNLSVSVNADTGEVQDYNLVWEDYEFPAAEGTLTLEKAQEVFKTKGLKLVYLRQYNWREQTNKPYLAYTLENGSSMQIDAITGEITYGGYRLYNGSMKEQLAGGFGAPLADSALTPWELKEIETIAGLLTIEQIEAIALEIIDLPEKAQLRSSRLMEDKSQNLRFWDLEWEYMVEEYYVGASARLNAADGEIQNFYFWEKNDEKIDPKLTYEEALTIAREFLQKWVPAKYKDVELTSKFEQKEGEPLPHSYSFTFERRINGVPVIGDSLSLSVQHDKHINSFYSNWYHGEFPSAAGVLTVEAMNEIFLQSVGLKLEYVHHLDTEVTSKFAVPTVKLVYKTNETTS